ncbi:MAG: hypothetical protein Q8K59_02240 [Nitrosomonas sp.]|nr:hypothetical protein [Nitrosomonas sp.]
MFLRGLRRLVLFRAVSCWVSAVSIALKPLPVLEVLFVLHFLTLFSICRKYIA